MHIKCQDLVAEHLDHLHYLNDILCLNIESLNRVLSDHLLNRLFIPLYLYSLARKCVTSAEELKPFVSPVVALFLLCQVFLIITHVPLGTQHTTHHEGIRGIEQSVK
jgi:protein CLEC16A